MAASSGGAAKPTAAERLPAWVEVSSMLQLVRDIRAFDKVDDIAQRRAKLRELGRLPYFSKFRRGQDDETRGAAICATVLDALRALGQELPAAAGTAAGLPEDKAILLWLVLVAEALSLPELSQRLPQLFRDASSNRPADVNKRAMRMRGLMWHPGNHPGLKAQPGIESILRAIQFAFDHPELAGSSFDWEWDRLQERQDQLQLLSFLAYLAPSPVYLSFIFDGARVLPSPLRRTFTDARSVTKLLSILVNRGLLRRIGKGSEQRIGLPKRVRDELRRRTTARERRLILDRSLRFVTEALPPNSHFFEAWPQWRANLPALDAMLAESADIPSLRMRRAHLFDRRSVFFREADQNIAAALADAKAAVELAELAGAPDPAEYAIYLGNLAMVEDRVGRWESAVDHFDQSLAVTKSSRGTENDDYASTLELKANTLHFAGKMDRAGRSYAQAAKIIRRVYAKDPSDVVGQVYREVLNDYAAFLLRDDGRGRPRDRARAGRLLNEVAAMIGPHDHGWFEVHSNVARLAAAEQDWPRAHESLVDLLAFCEINFGEISLQTYATLRDLTDTARALGLAADAEEYDLRAHEVDDALAAADDDPEDEE